MIKAKNSFGSIQYLNEYEYEFWFYDDFKVFGSRIRVDSVAKVAELELAEKEKMKEKVDLILKHDCTVFINR